MAVIDSYKEKKLVDYLYDGARVLVLFGHGLGDTIMFYPVFEALKREYPNVHFSLYVECGQEEIFGAVSRDDSKYDLAFTLHYPMSEHLSQTKNEYCCVHEIGIDPSKVEREFAQIPSCRSPLVALHFNSTALPGTVNCPATYAQRLWYDVIGAGLVPIECHFEHVFHNPVNEKYDFVDCTVRKSKARVSLLIGLLQRCIGFIGVASGPLTLALSMFPSRVLYLENTHRLSTYTRDVRPLSVDVRKPYDEQVVQAFLKRLVL